MGLIWHGNDQYWPLYELVILLWIQFHCKDLGLSFRIRSIEYYFSRIRLRIRQISPFDTSLIVIFPDFSRCFPKLSSSILSLWCLQLLLSLNLLSESLNIHCLGIIWSKTLAAWSLDMKVWFILISMI